MRNFTRSAKDCRTKAAESPAAQTDLDEVGRGKREGGGGAAGTAVSVAKEAGEATG